MKGRRLPDTLVPQPRKPRNPWREFQRGAVPLVEGVANFVVVVHGAALFLVFLVFMKCALSR